MILVAVIALFVALGSAVDAYMYKKEKSRLYQKMEGWIAMIDKTKPTEIHLRMIDMALGIYHRMFNRKKPVRSFIVIVSVSWVLTSVMYVFGILYSDYDKGVYNIVYWHDYLPWYPVYVVNLIFDAITIYITIKILERIRNKKLTKSIVGIFIDAIIAYCLLILCLITFDIGTIVFRFLNLGTEWTDHHYAIKFQKLNLKDKLSENLFLLGVEKNVVDGIFKSGFTENAKIEYSGPDPFSNFSGTIQAFPNGIFMFFNKNEVDSETYFRFTITEAERSYLLISKTPAIILSSHLSTAMTTFLPTLVYLLILLIMYVSKEIIYVTRQFSLRFLKSAVENAAGETFDVSKFKPGLHFGILLGVLSALVKLAIELAKMA